MVKTNKKELSCCADYTKYPKIYARTYWGCYTAEPPSCEIVDNRNSFIQEFNIKSKANRIPNYVKEHYKGDHDHDHVEVYRTNANSYVVISSPYGVNDAIAEKFDADGWKVIGRMYSSNATTFYKIIRK